MGLSFGDLVNVAQKLEAGTLEQITVTCTDTGKSQKADVLHRSDKAIRCAFVGTTVTLNLSRTDLNKPFTAYHAGLEFTSKG